MLQFGEKAHFSFEDFLKKCENLIPENDLNVIKNATGTEKTRYDKTYPTLKRWRAFDTALRNELVKIRASRKHVDASLYLREGGYTQPSITNAAMNAYKNPSMLESEKILDEVRWWVLDELSIGHYFDIDFLMIYANKLRILEKWDKIRTSDKSRVLEETLQKS